MTTCVLMRSSPPRDGVLHVITDPRRRGAQTFAHDLHDALLARGAASDIVALAPDPTPADPRPAPATAGPIGEPTIEPTNMSVAGVAPTRLTVPVLGDRRLGPRTLAALRARMGRARVVVAHGSTTLPACAAAGLLRRTPFIYVNIGDPRHWAATPAKRLRVGAMLRRAAAVASVSPIGRDLLVARYRLPASRVTAIPNGRRPEAYPRVDADSRARARKELGVADAAVVLAVVGALGPEKRVDIAIEAFARLADEGRLPDGADPEQCVLLVAGDGTERDRLAGIAARRAPGRVRFLGTVHDAAPVYRASDALLLTSDSEGVPGVLVEAGLSGIPAVATNVGFVRDVVLDGSTGALVAPGDPAAVVDGIGRVLADAERLGAAAYEHCQGTYAMESVVDSWQDLLDAVARPARMVDKA